MIFITKKHLPRRTFLRGMGVTLALPLLDSMVPAQTPLGKTAAAPEEPLLRHLRPARRHHGQMDSRAGRRRFRILRKPEAARKAARSRLRGEQPGASGGQRRRLGCRRGSRPFRRRLPERRASGEGFRARRHDCGPGAGPAHRPGHAAAIARTGHRRSRLELRLRLRLRLFQHHLLAHADAPAAHGEQSAGGVRAAVRRRNQFGAAPFAEKAGPQHPRFGHRQSRAAAGQARSQRPRPPQRISRRHPRNRAPHSESRQSSPPTK